MVIHQHLALSAEPASVRTGRRFLHDVLDDCVPTDLAETAVLLGSEAITNAVVHAGTPLVLECYSDEDRGELVVEVSDLDETAVLSPVAAAGLRSLMVTPDLDAGPTIRQVRVPVNPGESATDLADRVLAVEHEALVAVLAELSGSMTAASPAPIRALR